MKYTAEQVQENRRKGVEHLRRTTLEQGRGVLYSPQQGCYCALGHLGLAVGIDASVKSAPGEAGHYSQIEDAYGLSDDLEEQVWTWNDMEGLSLRVIGTKLARMWGIK